MQLHLSVVANLKDRENAVCKRVKVCPGFHEDGALIEGSDRKLAAKDLGAQQGEDAQEQEEQDQEGHDGLDRVDEGGKQVFQRAPVPVKAKRDVVAVRVSVAAAAAASARFLGNNHHNQ